MSAAATSVATLSLNRVFASPALSGPTPRLLKLSPDGRRATLLKPRADDKDRYDLWEVDTTSGQSRLLVDSASLGSAVVLSEAERMNRERRRIGEIKGIVDYSWSRDGQTLLVPVDGDLWLAGIDGSSRRLTSSDATETDAQLSPRGGYVSFVRDRNLHIIDLATGSARALTADATDTISWGSAEFIAQEELQRFTGLWWASDDLRLAVQRTDESSVALVERTAIGAAGTTVFAQRYPAAGTANAVVELWLMAPDGRDRVQVDLGPDRDIYLARVDWAADNKSLYVQRLSRDQQRLDLLQIDARTGAATLVFSEQSPTWINLGDDFRALDDGSLLWSSERSGYRHIYHWQDGRLSALTSGDWAIDSIVGVVQPKPGQPGKIYFLGFVDTPLERQLYAIDLAPGSVPRRLTARGGTHAVVMDKAATAMLVTRETPVQPPQTWLADAQGQHIAWIEANRIDATHPYAPYSAAHVAPEFGTISASDGTALHYKLLRPAGPGPHPVLFNVYGGPHATDVAATWTGALNQYLVQNGWAVFQLANRGGAGRGKAFEDGLYRRLGGVEVEDQLAGLAWLKTQDFVAPDRIAVNGWSYGGYMTLKLLEAAPKAFAAGIAGAPVTRWELYDTAYTERYLGTPDGNPEAYAQSNALADAGKIERPLLIVHGMADDNVVFEHSTALMAALQKDKRPFDVMVYPGATHAVGRGATAEHLWMTILRFLGRTVAPTGY
ncbi:MAG: DPP IV N-terminal domain-containing protein [Polymorphobacter sp.]